MFNFVKNDSELTCAAVDVEIWLPKQLHIALKGCLGGDFFMHFIFSIHEKSDLFNITISKLYLLISLAAYFQLFS